MYVYVCFRIEKPVVVFYQTCTTRDSPSQKQYTKNLIRFLVLLVDWNCKMATFIDLVLYFQIVCVCGGGLFCDQGKSHPRWYTNIIKARDRSNKVLKSHHIINSHNLKSCLNKNVLLSLWRCSITSPVGPLQQGHSRDKGKQCRPSHESPSAAGTCRK